MLIAFVLVSSVVLAIVVVVATSARAGGRADAQADEFYRAHREGAIAPAPRPGVAHDVAGDRHVAMAAVPEPEQPHSLR